MSLGIRDGPDMARLKNGESVGDVRPEMVVGPRTPGASIAYTGDTMPCETVIEGCKGATALVHESTYMSTEAGLAADHFHSTARQAAEVAMGAGVGMLLLTHVSNRYDDRGLVEEDARAVFPDSVVVDDMDWFEVLSDSVRRKVTSV